MIVTNSSPTASTQLGKCTSQSGIINLRGGTAKITLTMAEPLLQSTLFIWYSSFICRFLDFHSRASRSASPPIIKNGFFSGNNWKSEEKLKCKGSANDFLAMLDPPYKGQSTGNHLYFPMVPFFCREHLSKTVEKVIWLKKCLKLIDFSVGFCKSTEPGITEKTDFQFLV